MVTVYAISLALGLAGLLAIVFGGVLAENLGRSEASPGERTGAVGRAIVAGLAGFGAGGMSAEFSPLGFTWQVSLLIAAGGAAIAVIWARFAGDRARS